MACTSGKVLQTPHYIYVYIYIYITKCICPIASEFTCTENPHAQPNIVEQQNLHMHGQILSSSKTITNNCARDLACPNCTQGFTPTLNGEW